ncbi:hypothetical protein AMECASPLE_036402 [Ameca splendens]|uniref:Uncharacterized protein n=1 Tax=Ameca splendens TaxID=208324 RepID=A0ABV0XKU3_9TELE
MLCRDHFAKSDHTSNSFGCQAGTSSRRLQTGLLVIPICSNRSPAHPTRQPNPACTLTFLLRTTTLTVTLSKSSAILHQSSVPVKVQLQHVVPIRQISQKSEVNLL